MQPLNRNSCNYAIRHLTNQRDRNEDSFQIFTLHQTTVTQPITIMAIADGMGGHEQGEIISTEALRKLSLALFEQLVVESTLNQIIPVTVTNQDLANILYEAVQQAHIHIKKIVNANNWGTAGSTIVVTAIVKDTAVVVNLGDSPLFHYQASNRQLTQITDDHSVAGMLLKADLITSEMARFHEGKNKLEFFIGCNQLPSAAPIYQIKLEPQDLLLLCSDGISGSLSFAEITNILIDKKSTLEEKADSLVCIANKNGATDNQTLIISMPLSKIGEQTTVLQ